jgi:hypothetical protein
MRNFVCWDEAGVEQALVDDANRDAPAIFNAVHRPTRIMRKDIRASARDAGTLVDERAVFAALVGDETDRDIIVPVVGGSGTGKSHLVRWLAEHIPESDRWHVVYIEKRGTSLKQVVHRILERLDAPGVVHREEFRKLRAQVDEAAEGLNPDTARLRLLNSLAFEVLEHGADTYANEDEQIEREDLRQELYEVLSDSLFRESLIQDGGVIAAIADKALGRGDRDGESPEFETLRLAFQNIQRASAAAREAAQSLWGDEKLERLALKMLNEQLTPALGALINVDRTRIYDIMLKVRETLLQEHKTLVLLVEDFALLRGVETQLLDAIIADPERQGTRVLCPIRCAFAVTRGYFDGKETARTRIGSRGEFEYSLDTDLGESDSAVSREDIYAFVATYMNAVRLGRPALEAAFSAAREEVRLTREWVANHCNTCDFHDVCHDGFGAAEDYGLYPLNESALDRIVDSQLEKFDPRRLLGILDRTLRTQRAKIEHGEFPDPEWARRYNEQRIPGRPELPALPASVGTLYEQLDPATAERRKILITFWGGVPDEAVNLNPVIHEAFDLPELRNLTGAEAKSRRKVTARVKSAPEPTKDEPKPKEDRERKALDRWSKTGFLDQALANRVRKAMAAAVLGSREWSALGIASERLKRVIAQPAFSLGDKALGEGATGQPIGILQPSDPNADLLQGMLRADEQGNWEFERGSERMARLAVLADEWADTALSKLRDDTTVGATVQLLLISAAALGLAGPSDPPDRLLVAVFAEPTVEDGDDQWQTFRRRLIGAGGGPARRDLISLLLKSQALRRTATGETQVIGVDSAPILAAMDGLASQQWHIPAEDDLAHAGPEIRGYAAMLRRDLEREVAQRLSDLAKQRSTVLKSLGSEREAATIVKAVGEAYAAAKDNGVAPPIAENERKALDTRMRASSPKALDRLDELERVEALSLRDRLALVAKDETERVGPILAYVEWAESALNSSLEQIAARVDHASAEDAERPPVARVVAVLRELADETSAVPS